MPKGKKFDAAEKHFEKERLKLSRENDCLLKQLIELKAKNSELLEQIDSLENRNRQLDDWVKRLLELSEMSREEVRKLVDHEKTMHEAFEYFSAVKPIIFTGTLVPEKR